MLCLVSGCNMKRTIRWGVGRQASSVVLGAMTDQGSALTRADASEGTVPSRRPRIALIDALRGAALAAMFSYHFVWDLGFFGFIPADVPMLPSFKAYGHAIASTFLMLVGVSLVLANHKRIAWRHFFERLVKIAAAAGAITLVTLYLFPDDFIFFGILQCIALASIAALPFLRAPLWLIVAAALAALALPLFVARPFFDAPQWWWLGLGTIAPRSNDWRPFLPWFGVVLIGVGVGRAALARDLPQRLVGWSAARRSGRSLVWGGRHSLFLYLVHQPVFFALLYGLVLISGVRPHAQAAPFLRNCHARCVATGATSRYCAAVCGCILVQAQSSGLWKEMLARVPSSVAERRFRAVTRQCARKERPADTP